MLLFSLFLSYTLAEYPFTLLSQRSNINVVQSAQLKDKLLLNLFRWAVVHLLLA